MCISILNIIKFNQIILNFSVNLFIKNHKNQLKMFTQPRKKQSSSLNFLKDFCHWGFFLESANKTIASLIEIINCESKTRTKKSK